MNNVNFQPEKSTRRRLGRTGKSERRPRPIAIFEDDLTELLALPLRHRCRRHRWQGGVR